MSLLKTVSTVGGWTLAYRISSFVRDMAQSRILGAGLYADVFSLAFKFANILRKLFAEGAFNASFLPIFSNTLKDKSKEEAEKLASQVFTWLTLMVAFLMLVCLIFFRKIIHFYAPGIDISSEKFEHLVSIGRICSPYIAASFLAALFGGILNTLNRFAMPAGAQLILNIGVIIALFIGALWFPSAAYTMAWATFIAGAVQVAILWINTEYCGIHVGINFQPMMEEVKVFFKKLISGAIGAGVWQLNVIIDFGVLSFLPTGAVSYFYYTDHVNQFPIGILGIAFSTALLPPITRAIHDKNFKAAQVQMNSGLLFAFMFALPAAAILICLSEELTGAIYGGGNFGPEQVMAAAPALVAFAFGLPAYMATKVFTTVFFATKDTKTPLNGGIISIVSNLLFIVLLMPMMKHTGVALATTLSAWCNAIYLIANVHKLGAVKINAHLIKECGKQFFMLILMLISLVLMNPIAQPYYLNGGMDKAIAVSVVMLISICVFIVVGKMMNAFSFTDDIMKADQ